MNIFQTIWTALTNENTTITGIIGIPCMFLESFIFMLLITSILNISVTQKQKLLYVICIPICGIISNIIIPSPFDTFFNLLVFLISNIFILKTSILKGILGLIIPFIITIIVESFIARLYYIIFKSDYADGMNIPLNRLIISTLIYSANYIVYLLIKHFKISFSKLEIKDKKIRILLVLTCIFGIILIASQLYTLTFFSTNLPLPITLLSTIGLLTYFTVSIYTIFTVSKLEVANTNLEQAEQHNKTLELLQDNTRAFRHDFTNILIGMTGYIDKNDMEGLKKYHNQLLDDIKHVNNLTTLSPKVVNNPGIYNVLAAKYHKADELGIKINLEVFLDLNDLHMKIYEFTRILGILMDNAIEASKECEEKIINVSIRKDSRRHMQLLIIENTYKDKNIDTEKIYEKGYSTKEGNTGIGLWEIRQILKKNNNLNLFTSKTNELFSQQFEIYY